MPPVIGPPTLKLNSCFPSRAPNATTSPSNCPPNTSPDEVVVTAASIGRTAEYCHAILPLDASIAVSQPRDLSVGSLVMAQKSVASTYSILVSGLNAGPF